jgi:hypothetical protein
MTYAHRWNQQLDALQVVVSVGQPKRRLIKVSNCVLLLNECITYIYLTVLKSCRGPEHQKALEAKAEKHKLKALQTKFRMNPEVFDDEPTELLSEIDRDEDNMVRFLFFEGLKCSQLHTSFLIAVYLQSRGH